MKRFRFNLEKILKLREENEKDWEIKLGKVVSRCNSVMREMKSIDRSRREQFSKFRLSLGGLEGLQAAELYFRKMETDKKRLEAELEKLNEERAEVQKEYMKASNDRKVIEKLKERKSREYYKAQLIAEIKEIDDLNTQAAARKGL